MWCSTRHSIWGAVVESINGSRVSLCNWTSVWPLYLLFPAPSPLFFFCIAYALNFRVFTWLLSRTLSQLPFYQLLRQGKFDSVSAELNSTLNTSVWVHLLPEMEFTIPTVVQDGEISSTPKDDRRLGNCEIGHSLHGRARYVYVEIVYFQAGSIKRRNKNKWWEKSGRRRK